jgi:ribosome-associated translation inhibitor RaiA
MQIQVNSDSSVAVDIALTAFVEATMNKALDRFADQITRVEVHLSDVNSERFGTHDNRCLIEVRPTGRDPVVVTEEASTPGLAVQGAANKMKRLLTSEFGRLGEKS